MSETDTHKRVPTDHTVSVGTPFWASTSQNTDLSTPEQPARRRQNRFMVRQNKPVY